MASAGWILAGVLCLPNFYVFRTRENDDVIHCSSIFGMRPKGHMQAYVTFVSLFVFFIPCLFIMICYLRIFLKVASKVSRGPRVVKPGKIVLQSTKSDSLSKAKAKTLKMTVIIVATFIVLGLPYFICEFWRSFGNHTTLSPLLYSYLATLAVSNSSANPFIFLLFNARLITRRATISKRPATSFVESRTDMQKTFVLNESDPDANRRRCTRDSTVIIYDVMSKKQNTNGSAGCSKDYDEVSL